MKHATDDTLGKITPLLTKLRGFNLTERKLGVFYRKSNAFLHFHEEGDKIFADLAVNKGDWQRFDVTTPQLQQKLLKAIEEATDGRAC